MTEDAEGVGQTTASKSSFGEKLRRFLPGRRNATEHTPFFEAPKDSQSELILLEDKEGGWRFRDFFRMAKGLISYHSLPATMEQPSLLTSHMLDLRQYAQRKDNEEGSAVYRDPKTGEWFYLKNPVEGTFNEDKFQYQSGRTPDINGLDKRISIHSHPSHAREKEDLGDEFEELRLKTNLQSMNDLGIALFDAESGINIVVGKDLAVAICRTKQTPDMLRTTEDSYAAFYKTIFDMKVSEYEYQLTHPDANEFEKRLRTIARFCYENKMGCYMLRLRGYVSTRDQWTRMYPHPKNQEAAIQHLLQPLR